MELVTTSIAFSFLGEQKVMTISVGDTVDIGTVTSIVKERDKIDGKETSLYNITVGTVTPDGRIGKTEYKNIDKLVIESIADDEPNGNTEEDN